MHPRRRHPAAGHGDDLAQAFVQIQRAVFPRVVALGNQGVDFDAVAFGIEELAGDGVAHFGVGMADTMIDGHALGFEAIVEFFDLRGSLDFPGDMGN